jgi:hypothetical protein
MMDVVLYPLLISGLGSARSRLSQKYTLGCEWLFPLRPHPVADLLICAFVGTPKPTMAWAENPTNKEPARKNP